MWNLHGIASIQEPLRKYDCLGSPGTTNHASFDGHSVRAVPAEGKISEPEFAVCVGIDWADRKHVWCLQAAGSTKRETGELEYKVEAVEA